MTGSDILTVAGNLVANPALGNAEARYRSAISRAYYGAYHLVVALLSECSLRVPENHNGHEVAYQSLFTTGIPEAVTAARLLNDLRGERIKADYKLSRKGLDSPANAREKVEMAYNVSSSLENCLVEPTKSAFLAAVKSQVA
ncbi:MAG: HEPN domain-containing protein [Pirellulales bacterium]